MAPDEPIFPVGHIKGQCAAAQAWHDMAIAKGEDVNFVHSLLEQEISFHTQTQHLVCSSLACHLN